MIIMLLVAFCAQAQDSSLVFLAPKESDGLCLVQSKVGNSYFVGAASFIKE